MPSRPARRASVRVRTDALLVRRVDYGEADVVVSLLTEDRGLVSAIARAARRSTRRFAALEPMHLLRVELEHREGSELDVLVAAELARPRLRLAECLEAMEAAGCALRWLRKATSPALAEPALWHEANALLDALDVVGGVAPQALLGGAGLRILQAVGWGLELGQCVGCGRACAMGSAACVDPARGGLVCRGCGGARRVLAPERRGRLVAATLGEDAGLGAEDARVAVELVDEVLAAHAR